MANPENFQSFLRFYMERILGCDAVPNDAWGFVLDKRYYLSFRNNVSFKVGSKFLCELKVTPLNTNNVILRVDLPCADLDDPLKTDELKMFLRNTCIDLLFDQ